jgi:ribonuclease R
VHRKQPKGRWTPALVLARFEDPEYQPRTQRQILHEWHVEGSDRAAVRRILRDLLERGKLVRAKSGRLEPARLRRGPSVGLLRLRGGKAQVLLDDGVSTVEIPPRDLNGARPGDRVEVRARSQRDGRRFGSVSHIVERPHRQLLAVHLGGSRVQPFDPAFREPLPVLPRFGKGADRRDVVEVEIVQPRVRGDAEAVKVLDVLGGLDDRGMDIRVVSRKYELIEKFPKDVLAAAKELPQRVPAAERERRTRFEDPAPITIDGETAKDFDDAIAVIEKPRGGFRLWVHIADVAHFIQPGEAIDREAQRRGTSVYFPGKVVPMLPPRISDDLCSLRPGVERLVQSVILDLDAKGEPTKVRFADGLIRSAARLTYTQVADAISGNPRPKGVPAKILPMLYAADRLRMVLEERRRKRGSVDFDLPMPLILLDVEGMVTGITVEARNAAHRLIEECMLIANEAVATHLEEREWPTLYRIHEPPADDKVELLEAFVSGFGVQLRQAGGQLRPTDVRDLIEQVEGRSEQPLIAQMTLRSMKQAVYTPENEGHFGLAAPTYCHFTSPIRRYPDLVVHRMLRACRQRKLPDETWIAGLDDLGRETSGLERNAEAAERELLTWKKVALIRDRVGDMFYGVVTGVTSFGMFVQLTENLVEGLVKIENLGNERFIFDPRAQTLTGSASHTVWRLGQPVRVQVEKVDRIRQRVDFDLVTERGRRQPREPAPRGRARKGRKKVKRR